MNKKICSCLAWLVVLLSFFAEDLWRYRYQVSVQNFLTDFGFDIFFDVADGYLFDDHDIVIASFAIPSEVPEPGT